MRHSFLFLTFITYAAHSQELVPNGGFEEELQPPCGYMFPGEPFDSYTANWYSPSFGSPDYFSNSPGTCDPIPVTMEGNAATHTGDRMAGFIPYDTQGFFGDEDCSGEGTEYLQVQLLEPMAVGTDYRISAWLKVSPNSSYSCDGLGFAFTVEPVSHTGPCPLNVMADVMIEEPIGLEWTHIDTFFTATTAAQYLTIGRFVPVAEMECISLGNNLRSYYFIDDVSVLSLSVGVGQSQHTELTPIINPVREVLLISSTAPLHGATLRIHSISGALVKEGTLSTSSSVGSFDVQDLPPGGYVAHVRGQGALLFMKE